MTLPSVQRGDFHPEHPGRPGHQVRQEEVCKVADVDQLVTFLLVRYFDTILQE